MANLVEDFMALSCSTTFPTEPLLMLAEKEDSNDREFYSPCSRKICMTLSLPEAKGKKCIESRGWLITLGKSGEISLLNPFSREQIELPNLNTFPEYEYYANTCVDPQLLFVDRAVLSANPSDTIDFVLVVVHSTRMHLGFWKPGNKSWTRIDQSKGAFSDVNYHNGKFYAISYSGIVWVWDVSGPDLTVAKSIMMIDGQLFRTIRVPLVEYSGILDCRRPYIVESSSGDLLVVARNGSWIDDNGDYGVTNFIVIQLDVNKPEWKEIKSLGSDAIFVGHNAAFSVDATRFPDTINIKSNCVYFADDCIEAYYWRERGGGKDMGIYHLEDGKIERFDDVESFNSISPPFG